MKILTTALITVILRLPQWHQDVDREPVDQRENRAIVLAAAITDAADEDPSLAAQLVTQGFFESRFALHVHQDKCRIKIGECDAGRAKSVWQLQATGLVPSKIWRKIGGTDFESTKLAAHSAARVLRAAHAHCKDVEGTFAMYATGSKCRWKGAPDRVRFYRKTRAQIVAEMAKITRGPSS